MLGNGSSDGENEVKSEKRWSRSTGYGMGVALKQVPSSESVGWTRAASLKKEGKAWGRRIWTTWKVNLFLPAQDIMSGA